MARQDAGLPGRCSRHAAMMRDIRSRFYEAGVARAIYLASDGFGAGTDPDAVGWDWSGVRDSSPAAVEAMWTIAMAGTGVARP
jgi:hypothetical protein